MNFRNIYFWNLWFCTDIGRIPMAREGMWGLGHGLHTRATFASVNHRVYHAFPLWSNEWNVIHVNLTKGLGLRIFLCFFPKMISDWNFGFKFWITLGAVPSNLEKFVEFFFFNFLFELLIWNCRWLGSGDLVNFFTETKLDSNYNLKLSLSLCLGT